MTDEPEEGPKPTLQDVLLFILAADDDQMKIIRQAFKSRATIRAEERRLLMLSQVYVGSRVRLNGTVSPKMLQWRVGTVRDIRANDTYIIELDAPPSRKWEGTFGVEPTMIELI